MQGWQSQSSAMRSGRGDPPPHRRERVAGSTGPENRVVLQRKAGEISCAVDHLAQYILSELGNIGG